MEIAGSQNKNITNAISLSLSKPPDTVLLYDCRHYDGQCVIESIDEYAEVFLVNAYSILLCLRKDLKPLDSRDYTMMLKVSSN